MEIQGFERQQQYAFPLQTEQQALTVRFRLHDFIFSESLNC